MATLRPIGKPNRFLMNLVVLALVFLYAALLSLVLKAPLPFVPLKGTSGLLVAGAAFAILLVGSMQLFLGRLRKASTDLQAAGGASSWRGKLLLGYVLILVGVAIAMVVPLFLVSLPRQVTSVAVTLVIAASLLPILQVIRANRRTMARIAQTNGLPAPKSSFRFQPGPDLLLAVILSFYRDYEALAKQLGGRSVSGAAATAAAQRATTGKNANATGSPHPAPGHRTNRIRAIVCPHCRSEAHAVGAPNAGRITVQCNGCGARGMMAA